MTAPNIIGATTINGKTSGVSLTTINSTTILNNPSDSNKCLKVNTLNVSNILGTNVLVTVRWHNAANGGGTGFSLITNAVVPTGSTLSVIDKTGQYYLDENTSLTAITNTSNALVITASYEEIG